MESRVILETIEMEISNPCNERCVHCYRLCKNSQRGFLKSNKVKDILVQAKELGAKKVTFTGGEALLNPEWKKILKIAEELDFIITLFTNGTLITEDVGFFLKELNNLKEVQISLYSLNAKIHDSITGLQGSFNRTIEGIKILKRNNVSVFISCPCMKENKNDVLNLIKWCDSNSIPNCSELYIFQPSDYTTNNNIHKFSEKDYRDFFQETMKNNGQLSYIWGRALHQDLSKIPFYGSAINSICISGNGEIYPMIGWYNELGNINYDSLEKIYINHPLLKKIRTITAADMEECRNCEASSYCYFCPTPHLCANHGQLYKIDKDYCKFIRLRKQFIDKRDEILQC